MANKSTAATGEQATLLEQQQHATAALPLVGAIDIGWGCVKTARFANSPEIAAGKRLGDIVCNVFRASAFASEAANLRDLARRPRDTVDVAVGTTGAIYEVGPGIEAAQTGEDFGREIDDNYSSTDVYEALMKGALHYMGMDRIDVLVLGLPVNQYKASERVNALVAKYANKEVETALQPDGSTKKVSIGEVVVRPQPFGGYTEMYNHLDSINESITATNQAIAKRAAEAGKPTPIGSPLLQKPEDLDSLTVLVADPGEHTLDWLMLVRGEINSKASDAVNDGGRYKVLRAVADGLAADIGSPLPAIIIPRIDEALRAKRHLKIEGISHDLSHYDAHMRAAISDPIRRLVDGTRGMMSSVELIILVGGHPELYRDELARRFPNIPIVLLDASIESNVRGFLAAAAAIALNQQQLAA